MTTPKAPRGYAELLPGQEISAGDKFLNNFNTWKTVTGISVGEEYDPNIHLKVVRKIPKLQEYNPRKLSSIKAIQWQGNNFKQIRAICPEARNPKDIKHVLIVPTGEITKTERPKDTVLSLNDWLIWHQSNIYQVMDDFAFRLHFEA